MPTTLTTSTQWLVFKGFPIEAYRGRAEVVTPHPVPRPGDLVGRRRFSQP
jgi:hypothetical protein